MDHDIFLSKRSDLKESYDLKVKLLCKEYAFSKNKVNKGDVLTDTSGTSIRVDEIKFTVSDLPLCAYYGFVLTKKGAKRKDGERCYILSNNIK